MLDYRGKVDYVYIASKKGIKNLVTVGVTIQPWNDQKDNETNKKLNINYIRPVKEGYGERYATRLRALLDYSVPEVKYPIWFKVSVEDAIAQIENADWWFEEFLKEDIDVDYSLIEFLNYLEE